MVIDHPIPATPEGREWLWEETKRVLDKYPDLREKVNRRLKEERDEDEEEIKKIISEWEDMRKRKKISDDSSSLRRGFGFRYCAIAGITCQAPSLHRIHLYPNP